LFQVTALIVLFNSWDVGLLGTLNKKNVLTDKAYNVDECKMIVLHMVLWERLAENLKIFKSDC